MSTEEKPLAFWIDLARAGFEDDLHRLMRSAGVNRTELAEAAGVSPAFVSKVLNGSTNYTLKTMARLARADRGFTSVRFEQEPASAEVIDLVSRRACVVQIQSGRVLGYRDAGTPVRRRHQWLSTSGAFCATGA